MKILGIDPGKEGAFVFMVNGVPRKKLIMPLNANNDVDFDSVIEYLNVLPPDTHIYLEKAVPFSMGTTGAFNYGRDFATLEIAVKLSGRIVHYVEPGKWTKVIHEGIHKDLKPKAKSIIALERLFPGHLAFVPKSKPTKQNPQGKYHEGTMDALLIAAYGERHLS